MAAAVHSAHSTVQATVQTKLFGATDQTAQRQAHYIYWDREILAPVVCFAELV